jgi:hypothetical protein
LGYGVSNDRTWCHLLTVVDPRLETVNMGQAGYGVDQAYLWYKRDAHNLEHQLHLLAVITSDFYRMQSTVTVRGYGKPVIQIENNSLVAKNVPVPNGALRRIWLSAHLDQLNRLRSVEFFNRLLWRVGIQPRGSSAVYVAARNQETREVVKKILEDLKATDDARSRRLVLVYLPQPAELKGEGPTEWITLLEMESQALGIPLIDVLATFRGLADAEATRMFIHEGQLAYPGAAGHLTNEGNRLVAEVIYKELQKSITNLTRNAVTDGRLEGILR